MDKNKGYVAIWRCLQEHWLWQDKPFNYGSAWIDMILSANHQDVKKLINGQLINIKRGEFISSIDKLSLRWGWSRGKTKRFIQKLKNDQSILIKQYNTFTIFSLLNYDNSQKTINQKCKNGKSDISKIASQIGDQMVYQTDTNNNDNNDNNDHQQQLYKYKGVSSSPSFTLAELYHRCISDAVSIYYIEKQVRFALERGVRYEVIEKEFCNLNNKGLKVYEILNKVIPKNKKVNLKKDIKDIVNEFEGVKNE